MEDNISKVYSKLVSGIGYQGTEDDFRNYLSVDENIPKVYNKLVSGIGYKGTEDDFRSYIGKPRQQQPEAAPRVDVADVEQAENGGVPVEQVAKEEIPTVTMEQMETPQQQPANAPGSDGHFLGNITVGADGVARPMGDDNPLRNPEAQSGKVRPTPPPKPPKYNELVGREEYTPPTELTYQGFQEALQKKKELEDEFERIRSEKAAYNPKFGGNAPIDPEKYLLSVGEERQNIERYIYNFLTSDEGQGLMDRYQEAIDGELQTIEQQGGGGYTRLGEIMVLGNAGSAWTPNMTPNVNNSYMTEQQQKYSTEGVDYVAAKRKLNNANKQLRMVRERLNGDYNGFVRGLRATDIEGAFSSIELIDNIDELILAKKINNGDELTPSQQSLLRAATIQAVVDAQYANTNTTWENVGKETFPQLVTTAEFVAGSYMSGSMNVAGKVSANMAERYTSRMAGKAVQSETRRLLARGAQEGVGYLAGAAVQTFANPLSYISMMSDVADKTAGSVYFDENDGQIHCYDNGKDLALSLWQAAAGAYVENLTEFSGEGITKVGKVGMGKLYKAVPKLEVAVNTVDGFLDKVKFSKITGFEVDAMDDYLRHAGFNGTLGEFSEEVLGNIIRPFMYVETEKGESYGRQLGRGLKNLVDADQNIETFLSCAVTSAILGTSSTIRSTAAQGLDHAAQKREVEQNIRKLEALMPNINGFDLNEYKDYISNHNIEEISQYIKEQAQINNWNDKELGMVAMHLMETASQQAIIGEESKQIQETIGELREQAKEMVNRWDGNNIYNVSFKDADGNMQNGTVVNGRVHYTQNDEGYQFNPYLSSAMLAIRLADGSIKQVSSRQVMSLQSVLTIDEQLQDQEQTVGDLLRSQFEQDGLMPTVESVFGGQFEAGVTQLMDGRYTYLGIDDDGMYSFNDADAKNKDNPVVKISEEALIAWGLRMQLNSPEYQANASDDEVQQTLDMADFMESMDRIKQTMQDDDATQAWRALASNIGSAITWDGFGGFNVSTDPNLAAAYLYAESMGNSDAARESINKTLQNIAGQLTQMSADQGGLSISETVAGQNAMSEDAIRLTKQAEYLNGLFPILDQMDQRVEQLRENDRMDAASLPVSQMEVGTEFPVTIQDGAVARVEGKDADGRSVVSVYDADGNILEAGIDDWSDEFWEGVRVRPQAAMESQQEGTEQESSEIEQNPPTIEQKEPEIEQKEETPLSPAQQTYNDLVQKYGDKAGHKIDVTAEDKSKTLDKAKKALEKAQTDYDDAPIGKEEKAEAALQKAQQEYETALAEQQEWNEVKSVKDRLVAEQLAAQQAAEEQRRAEAVAEEQARQEAEEKKAQERAELGSNNVAPSIRDKWDAAVKAEGNADEITLANGERVTGHYVLVESGAASPSHNALDGFRKTEGFPMDENEQSVNDRDYERDPHAQSITRQIAADYDNRALQTPVVVSQDGVVLSGNGRTMAGEIAAAQNTDGAYIDYLKKYAQKYGFAPEEVEAMQHPRVVFVPDASMPYTAETFAKFNQQEMKGQSKTEQAVKLGKLVDDATFGRIIRSINRFDTLGDFYADTKATADAIGELLKAGAINQMQHAEMFDGESISAQGREILENMLIGKAFESNPDAVRQLTAYKSLRQSVITALAEISNNIALGEEYSLERELSQAIALAYQARQNGYKAGDRVSEFARTGVLFQGEALTVAKEGATAADYTNATVLMLADLLNDNRVTRLKKALQVYNHQAEQSAGGQTDLFAGDVKTQQDILNEVLLLLQHGTETEQQQAIDAAVEQRKSAAEREESVQQDGDTGESSEADREAEEPDRGTVEEIHVPQVQEVVEEIDDDDVFPKPDVEVERIRSLRQALADGYASGNKEAIQKAVDELKKYVDEGLDTDTYYSEEIDDYEGDDPMMLAERYITHLYQDRYLDDDEDQEYIKTGIRSVAPQENAIPEQSGYTISPAQYTTKKGKVLNMQLVRFDKDLTKEQQRAANALARDLKGWWSRDDGGFMMRDEETAQQLIEAVLEESGETLQEAAPLSLSDMRGETEQTGPTDSSVAAANEEVDTNPTEAQKEAGNYKKGHVKIDGFDISIENPAGSTRSGTDAQGNPWSVTMHNSYGYIRMTEGVDGDHIDVFLSDHIDDWNGTVYVVDQVNEDGSFDEHKVMYGFNSAEEAREAYLSNYSEGWQGLGTITGVSREEFRKWVDSSHRKTKAFADYKSVQTTEGQSEQGEAQRADELFDSVGVGDVFVNDKGLSFTIDKKVDGKSSKSQAVRIQWELQIQDEPNGRGTEIFNKIKFLKYVEANGMRKVSAAMESRTEGTEQEATNTQPTEQPTTSTYGASNRLVSQSRYEELKRKMQEKLGGQMNMGIDPEILAIGTEMAVYHIEAGARKFADFCKNMVADLGDAIRPYLKSFYNGARDLPEMEEAGYLDELTPYDEVKTFDVNGFDKGGSSFVETAQEAVKEAEVEQQAAEAETKLKQQRNDGRKLQDGELSLRPATEADFDSEHPIVYYQGKPYGIIAVMRSGEQVGATQFSKPHLDNVILTNGESVTIDQLQVVDRDAEEKIKEIAQKGKKTTKKKEKVVSSQPSLFGEETENTETNQQEDGLQRNDEPSPARLPAESVRHEEGGQPKQTTSSEGVGQENRGTDTDGGGNRTQSDRPLQSGLQRLNPKNTRNNHAERGTDYAPKSVDARIEANIKAIELMQQLIESGEQATPEQMAVLRQFSGWGGLGKAFSETTEIYGVKTTAGRLRDLLGDEGYEQANMSRNSAYYTPAEVIDALWDIARAMGFKGGNVLEGSAGIGNILGLMPADMSAQSDIHAVEIDQTTGSILSLLYPDARVEVQGFEATQVENGSVDLAITNVPFVTGLRVNDTTGDKDLSKKFHDIHDFCIAKNIRKLREGGIGIFITSSGTLDNSARLREWIIGEGNADVVGAFRLNNETFGGTGVTSDIVIVRKRVNGKKSPHAIDVSVASGERVAEFNTGATKKVKGEEVPIVKQLSMDYNKYFIEHPEMMAGEMHFGFEKGETFRPTSKSLYPVKGKDQSKMLADWIKSFEGKDWEKADVDRTDKADRTYEALGDDVKEGSMVINKDGVLCIAQRGQAVPLEVNANKVKGHTKIECFQAYQGIKKALAEVLSYQTENEDDNGLNPLLKRLNKAYDDFVKTYGHLHKNTAINFLKNDVDWPNIIALEKFSETGDKKGERVQTFGKTDIFSRRVVDKEKDPEPKNVKDGIIASIYLYGRIDVPYLSQHLGMSEEEIRKEIVSQGLGFENPTSREMEVSYEYLSGNVREKLRQAQENNTDGRYAANIKALEERLPMSIPAHLIDFSIGSSWIDPQLYADYVRERTDVSVSFAAAGGTWFMKTPSWVNEQKNRAFGIISEMFHKTIMGTQLIEAAMQNRTITVSETRKHSDGTTETVTDQEATQACASKIDEIRQDFKDWAKAKMQTDPEMSERMEQVYNEMFNNYVPKEIPDEFVPQYFGGATRSIQLRPHQAKAVIRGTTQPLLLAHEVGTGKTFTLISTAMEMRRLGIATKPMIVVQNATVGQFVESAKQLYPNAKVLTIEDKDHTIEGRKNFYAKIKYNDWDMIVVPQSVFERIPDSEERQMAFVKDKIEEKMLVLEKMREADGDGRNPIVRQAEKEIEQLEDQMAALSEALSEKRKTRDAKKEAVTRQNAEVKALEMLDRATDDVENFDDMGIDAILVDEAHEYKHLGFATAMQRGVKGVDPSYSKKAQGVFLKAQAVLEKNNGRNVIFATGTPISNTAAEIWTFMRYLMPAETMQEYGIYYFDDFVRNFGNLQQMLEFTTSGKFKENNRFAGYINLPELVRIWSGVADTVLTREAGGVNDKIPDMEGGKAQDIYLPQTKALRSIMKFVKAELERFENMSGKEKKKNSHIPLVMYGIAKAAAVDARLVDREAEDDPNSKTNEAVRQTLRSLEETKDYRGTVAIFADNYQNKESGFNIYEDIRQKLIEAGVPAEQIVVMKSGMSVKKKLEIFEKMNRGEVRVMMGSTFTLGTGVNIQERLHTLIHLDAPNRPMDYTQRNGRILRQGNIHKQMGKPVRVLRFGVEDSLDVTAYQRLKTKGAIADSIMNGKAMMANSMENRVLEEEEDVFGDTVAQLSGSEYAMLKNQAEKDVRKYEAKRKQWEADQTYIHNQLPRLEGSIRAAQKRIEEAKAHLEKLASMPEHPKITIGKYTFGSIDEMADFIKEYNAELKQDEAVVRGNMSSGEKKHRKLTVNVGGIDFVVNLTMTLETVRNGATLSSVVRREMTYSCEELGLKDVPVFQMLFRNAIEDILTDVVTGNDARADIESAERVIERDGKAIEQLKERDGVPFAYDKELQQAHQHLDEYSALMKKEMEEKEAKYAEMDSEVEAATGLTEAEEAEEESDVDLSIGENEEGEALNGSQQLAFDAVTEVLANAGIEVVEATAEDVEKLKASVRSIEDSKGVVRGWVGNNGKIYLTKDGMTAETPIHEYTHLWADALQMNNPELWEQIKELLKGTPEWNRILSSPGYSYLRKRNGEVKDEDRLAGEVLAHISGKKNAERMEAEAKKMIDEAENYAEAAKAASLLGRMRDALKKFWTWVGKTLLGRKGNINIEQVQNMVLADLVNGVDPFGPNGRRRRGKRMSVDDNDTERINQKFNEELQRQIEGTLPSGHVYEMGMPSVYLRSTGIPNLPIRLQSSILNKKSDDPLHPYELEEVKDLVKLIQKPLAIFAYGDKTKSQNLMIGISQPTAEGKQFLVGLALNPDVNGKTLEINSVRNVFPKNYHDWIYWIIQGKMLRVDDRESIKAIIDALRINPVDYISDNDLDSAANIVENFENPQVEGENFSDVDLSIVGPDNHIADEYNRKTGYNSDDVSGYVRGKEELIRSFFDGLRPLEQMQQLIEKALGRKLRDSENAYGLATLLPSLNKAMMDKAETEFMLPVLRKSARIMRRVMRGKGVSMTEAREMLTNYLLAKHGLERNEWFYQQALANDPDAEEEDKAGLRGLAESLGENPDDYKDVAQRIVDEMEDDYLADSIWDDMKALTDRMLEISYEAGMIDKDTFEGLKSRHNYYVPLRGFADGTSGDLFDYVSRHPHFQSIFKKMKGRRSKADDPLANLYNMLQSAVVIGNQNKVMQNIYNLAVNSKSDLLRVAKAWYVHNDVTDEWEEKFPDIPEDATADDIDAIIKQFEADMEQLKQQGQAKQFTNRMQLGKRVLPYQAKEHEMVAYINGKKVMLFVAGNPLVAQALNKSNTQQLGWFAETVQGLTRFASRINTSLSPAFMFTNAARDIGFSLFSATVTGGLKKNAKMVGNLFRAGWVLPRLILTGKMGGGIVKMFSKEEAAKIEQWWNEFIDNGGETGFTSTLSTEKAKAQVDDMLRRMVNYRSKDGQLRLKKATFGVIETMGRYSEDISRFAAYCLKRAEGETVKGSVNEAKNVTVNFNVKGGGNSTIARFVAGCRACYSFFNASLQGINRMGRLAKENPKAFGVCMLACVLQGAMLPWLNMAMFALLGGDDDDWEKYEMLTEYTANHNLILYVGNHKFLKIPYSQELAPFAAMGNIWFRQQMGWNHGRSIASQVGNMFLDLSPVNIGESKTTWGKVAKTITPTIAMPLTEWALNENFTASPIEKRYDWNKFDKGWEKAYESKTSKWLIDASRWLDEKADIDINPSFVEHIATGMLGGIGRSGDNLMRYFSDGFQMQNAPYLRTIMFDSKQQGYIGAVSREYGRLAYEELPKMKHDVENMDMAEFANVVNTVDYQIANTVSMYKTGKDLMGNKTSFQGIDKLEKQYKAAQKASDGSEAAEEYLQAMRDQINEVKMEMLDAVDEIIYNNSGEGRRGRIDRVREIERESKEKYQERHEE